MDDVGLVGMMAKVFNSSSASIFKKYEYMIVLLRIKQSTAAAKKTFHFRIEASLRCSNIMVEKRKSVALCPRNEEDYLS